MKVILKANLFTPVGRFKKTSPYSVDLPEAVRPHLPKSAIIVDDKEDTLPVPRGAAEQHNEPSTLTEMNAAKNGVSALEHMTKKK